VWIPGTTRPRVLRKQYEALRDEEERQRTLEREAQKRREVPKFYDWAHRAAQGGCSGDSAKASNVFLGGVWQARRVQIQERMETDWELKWTQFTDRVRANELCTVHHTDVPWIPSSCRVTWIFDTDDVATRKRKIHAAMLRWHPDKFVAAFGGALADDDREKILEEVNLTASRLFKEVEELRKA